MGKIFLTGGTGFIGRHVVERLLGSPGLELTILTRQEIASTDLVTYVRGDLDDRDLLKQCITDSDYVFHLAGCKKDPLSFTATNVGGTKNILAACQASGVKKLIYLSSVGVVGATEDLRISENSSCCPLNDYEKSKYAAENFVRDFAKSFGGETYILRPSNVFGENDPELHLLNLIRKIKSNKFMFVGNDTSEFFLNYVYVKEISEVSFEMMNEGSGGGIYIVNTPTLLSEFICEIQDLIGNSAKFKHLPYWPLKVVAKAFDLVPKRILDPPPINSLKFNELTCRKVYMAEALKKNMGWEPKYTMREALRNLIDHYREVDLL